MAINWSSLRPWNGSQELAFEELCCQLAAAEQHPPDARFFRKGTPDAGVECFWQLKNGDEWAWQAKFFRSSPERTQWRQIDRSVRRAIDKHPRLTKYTVCLPIDLPDAREHDQKSAQDKWNDYVGKWEELASGKGMSVTFEYWGQSEIGARLSDEQHRGRHWFWFSEERFSNSWFVDRVSEAVANARGRYTPELNVDLPIRANFDALGRTPRFFGRLERLYSNANIAFRKLREPHDSNGLSKKYDRISTAASNLLGKIQKWVVPNTEHVEWTATHPIPWDEIASLANQVVNATGECISAVLDLRESRKKDKKESRPSDDDLDWQLHSLREFYHAVSEIADFALADACRLTNLPALLLVGEAGQGKTHLLCHVAKCETDESRPCLVFHGENFGDDEPWSQMIRLLGLTCSREEFIGALEAAGQANNCRLLIFIDALNEGEGNRLWRRFLSGILTTLAPSQWLGICISVRSCYERHIIPETLDESRIVRVEHEGFGDLAYEAAAKFFANFGIEPSAPILLPEFDNPLFLKLFCESLQNKGLTRVPSGLRGITAIFEFFIDSINVKLARPDALDFDEKSRVVPQAVGALADEMARRKTDRLPLEEAKSVVDKLLPREGYEKSLFRQLESEGVVTLVPNYWATEQDELTESVRFTYQRFSDHMIVQRLLERYLDKKNPKESFSKRRTLGKLLKDERACWTNNGILKALFVQVPELTGSELPDLVPHIADLHPTREAFVESIVWRATDSFSEATDRYVNHHVLAYQGSFEAFWDAVLSLAATPGHPYNADRLHKILSRVTMPQRDAQWSVFLHGEWGMQRGVDRLVKWAWEENDKSGFNDEVIRLAGLTLAWFFTSSHRFLRDRATKALIRLCENRLDVLRQVIEKLRSVDDPYVTERLYAAAYGCAMRTTDTEGLARLAEDVYGTVFEPGEPPPHVLLRDYARGVVEVALDRCPDLDVDTEKLRPPYISDWPSFEVPEFDELKTWGESKADMPDGGWAKTHLYDSVMREDWEDFSRYVIGELDEWSSEKLDEPHRPTHKERYDEFVASLTDRQKEAWDLWYTVRENADYYRRLEPQERTEVFERMFTDAELDHVLQVAEDRLKKALRKNSRKHRLFCEAVAAYVAEPHAYYRENAFDGQLARRWMMKRIIDMGWTVKRFGKFDRNVNRYGMHGRAANKPERIGKKYQWIAYHELLARLSDNFKLREDKRSVSCAQYNGPQDVSVRRDIDPSNLLSKTRGDEWSAHTNTWWFPATFDSWEHPIDEVEWLRTKEDLPDVRDVIQVEDPQDGSIWLALNGDYSWQQPTPPGQDRYEMQRRDLWYMLKCYLMKQKDCPKLLRWAKKQTWMGRWMPESHTSYDIFLGEFFWSSVFQDRNCDYYHREGWTRGRDDRIPCEVLVANDEYGRESGNFDCSLDMSIFVNMPCRFLVDGMGLQWRGVEGKWCDRAGKVIAFDPSVRSQGPRVLLFRRAALLQFLESHGLTLFWTLLGERRTIGGPMSHKDFKGHLEINGAYVCQNGEPSGGTRFDFVTPGPRREEVK